MLTLTPSTILFQILNFVILLVVVRRYLYGPLALAMQRREEAIAARLRAAEERARAADEARHEVAEEQRRAREEAERLLADARAQAARTQERILAEADAEAARRLGEADRRIREQERAALERARGRVTETAVALAAQLVRDAEGPSVHQAMLRDLLDHGLGLTPDDAGRLRRAVEAAGGVVTVALAYPPTDDERRRVGSLIELDQQAPAALDVRCEVDPSLVAGVRVVAGTYAVDVSLGQRLRALGQASAPHDAQGAAAGGDGRVVG